MKSTEFCYWLQGMFELNPPTSGLTQQQADMIKRHLQLVFKHEIDPSYPNSSQLTQIHTGLPKSDPIHGVQGLPGLDPTILLRC